MAVGAKQIETRSWPTNYRGWLAIHASQRFPRWAVELTHHEPFRSALGPWFNTRGDFPTGQIVAVGRLVDVAPTVGVAPLSDERAFGDYSEGRYMWLFEDVTPLATPLSYLGARGLWTIPEDEFAWWIVQELIDAREHR